MKTVTKQHKIPQKGHFLVTKKQTKLELTKLITITKNNLNLVKIIKQKKWDCADYTAIMNHEKYAW